MQIRYSASHAVAQGLSFISQWVTHSAQWSLQRGVHAEVGYSVGGCLGYLCS